MTIHILIEKFRHAGVGLELSASGLKIVAAPGALSPDILTEIKENKPALMEALTTGAGGEVEPVNGEGNTIPISVHPQVEVEESAPEIRGCFDCGYFDGKGPAWPGMCRFFETTGESAKEIDFNVVDPMAGCKCFMARSDGRAPAPAGAITMEADCITFVAVEPGRCPLCGKHLDQDGGKCWHRVFHIGAEEAAGAPPRNDQPVAAQTICGTPFGLNYHHWGELNSPKNTISPVADEVVA